MDKFTLNRAIMAALMHFLDHASDRHWTKMYHLLQQHPKLYRNQNHRYPHELFREGSNEAWASFNIQKIQTILQKIEKKGIAITPENGDRLIPELIRYINCMAINKTIDIWRKETYLVA